MKKKNGLSLIVLIITIIVVIVLASVVILTISKNNPIESAKEARFKDDVRAFQDELAMYISSEMVKDYNGIREKIITSNMPSTDEMKKYISSFSKKYEHKLGIYDDELVYYIADEDENVTNKLTDQEENWLKDLGIKERVIETSEELFEWGSNDPNNPAYYTLVKYNGTEENVTIPQRCKVIGNGAFKNKSTIKSVKIQEGVTTIGNSAFMNCYQLKKINLPNSITSIGERSFQGCEKIESITIPEKIRVIYLSTFFGCKSLKTVNFPDNLFGIHEQAFDNCTNLKNIDLPDSVGYLGKAAFQGTGLENVYLSKNCISLDDRVFGACQNLKNIFVDAENPSITSVDGVLYSKNKKTLIQYPAGKTDGTYTVIDGTEKLANDAFYICKNLNEVILPNSLNEIGEYCFCMNSSLENIKIPISVVVIKTFALDLRTVNIYCEAESKPSGWAYDWHGNGTTNVTWGYKE